jgi:hypothetical protein
MSAWSKNGCHNAILADALAARGIVTATPDAVETACHQLAEANDRSPPLCSTRVLQSTREHHNGPTR